jgi:glycosyltransferase involved in cell wall biosynthesis
MIKSSVTKPPVKPTVSVLMAVYNTQRYVAQAIESILKQTFTDFELILIDDGSTDRSLQILQHYAAQDARIRLTSRENRGIPKTRNEMLAQAEGEFIAILDSDDVALPDRLARQVEFLQQRPEVVWVGGAFELIDDRGHLLIRIALPESNQQIRSLLADGQISFLHPTAMLRRAAAVAVGGYDEELPLAEDLDLWLRLSEVGELANLAETVVQYRLHPNSICTRNQMNPKEAQEVLDRAWKKGITRKRIEPETVCGWRPSDDRISQHQFMIKYGWWAFHSQQRRAAVFYGTRAIALNPLSPESWKLLAFAAVKPLPKSEFQ